MLAITLNTDSILCFLSKCFKAVPRVIVLVTTEAATTVILAKKINQTDVKCISAV